jgi:tetratricopeptide (TPR) repeat protein
MDPNKDIQNNPENQRLIDGYILGTLNAKELSEIKERMALYPDFKTMVEEQKTIAHSVEEYNLKNSLDGFHEEIVETPPSKGLSYGWIALAASFLILIAVSSWAIFGRSTSTEKIFAATFKPDPGLPTTMGTSSEYNFYYGMVKYKRKEYADAISRWEPLYAAEPENDTLVYFLGVANLANGNARQAEKYLQMASENPKSAFYGDAQYYLGLSLLKENKLDEAKEILSKSTFPASKTLLEKLNKL